MAPGENNTSKGQAHSLTLERGLRVLRVLADNPDGLSVSELANQMSTHRPGIYRLLSPLLDQRLVQRDANGRYTLGVGLIELASRVRARLQEVALGELQRLADELGATSALTLREGDSAVVAAVLEPRSTEFHIAYRTGLRHRIDQAASGIAILAAMPPQPGERDAISEARQRGWAVSHSELLTGATGIGVAIGPPGNPAEASISAVWIGERDLEEIAPAVVAAAARIDAALHGEAAFPAPNS